MKKNFFIFLIAFTALSLFPAAKFSERLIKELNLSKEQTDKIDKFYAQNESKKLDLFTQLSIKKLELKKIFLKDENPERNIVKKAMEDIALLDVELKLLKFDIDKEILNILDNGQKQKYKIIRIRTFDGHKKPTNKNTDGRKTPDKNQKPDNKDK